MPKCVRLQITTDYAISLQPGCMILQSPQLPTFDKVPTRLWIYTYPQWVEYNVKRDHSVVTLIDTDIILVREMEEMSISK